MGYQREERHSSEFFIISFLLSSTSVTFSPYKMSIRVEKVKGIKYKFPGIKIVMGDIRYSIGNIIVNNSIITMCGAR